MAEPKRFERTVSVRFRDIDAMGHAHHSMVLVYIEEVRAAFWREVMGRAAVEDIDYVIASARLDFRVPIRFPGTLRVSLTVPRIGGSSFTMKYDVYDSDGELLAEAETTQVMYDYASHSKMQIPHDVREKLQFFSPSP